MVDVVLHIYDVTNSESEKANNTVRGINRFFKDGIGLGGIFHSAIELNGGVEWSYGCTEDEGTGVFSCPSGQNPTFTYREKIVLGRTECTMQTIDSILAKLIYEWVGREYDVLAKNCNHFCDALCEELGVPKLPGWVNRFANVGKMTIGVAENTTMRMKKAKSEVVSASKVARRFLSNVTSNVKVGSKGPPKLYQILRDSDDEDEDEDVRMKGCWLKGKLKSVKSYKSLKFGNKDGDANHATTDQHRKKKQSRDAEGSTVSNVATSANHAIMDQQEGSECIVLPYQPPQTRSMPKHTLAALFFGPPPRE